MITIPDKNQQAFFRKRLARNLTKKLKSISMMTYKNVLRVSLGINERKVPHTME